ncbi:MAG TPA: APC family permease [Stellaceae bacterium]|jgi:amino acid transporter|nr:APC family permease [Stellaceae bacterium]
MRLVELLIGRRLSNEEGEDRKITGFEGLPAMGLDGLSSSAYGPEAALTILMPLGAAGLVWVEPITAAILVLLAVLAFSYWQTMEAYPVNGGSYTVAGDNLGINAGLLAGTALMIDYVLNVAVGISAGVGALISALPALHPYTLWLCLAVLALITIINLRGTMEAGVIFALPTYLFILCLGGVLAAGVWQAIMAGGHPHAITAPPPMPKSTETVGLWLLLRAFASGCTAMTGVEAVSNGVSAFRKPTTMYAHRTLVAIVVILGVLLAGIAFLARAYGLAAMDQTQPGYQSVLSQLTGAVAGHGSVYFVTIASVLAVLCLSANTSFVDFPRLCRLVAQDRFLPAEFATSGRRLVNSVGIVWLAICAGTLLAVFNGVTDRLIPLFAVGAFLAFTLSQAGMAVHWWRQLHQGKGRRLATRAKLAINAMGAVATGGSLAIILAAKFLEGAWITVLIIPLVLLLLKLINRYYRQEAQALKGAGPVGLKDAKPPIVLIPIRAWDRLAERAVRCALQISPDVVALHLTRLEGPEADRSAAELRHHWQHCVQRPARNAGLRSPRLLLHQSPYRSIVGPLLDLFLQMRSKHPDRTFAVVLPLLVRAHWWDYLLHTRRVERLRAALLRHGGPDLSVIVVPWTLEPPDPETVIADEEPDKEPRPKTARHPRRKREATRETAS